MSESSTMRQQTPSSWRTRRATEQEPPPGDGLDSRALGARATRVVADDERAQLRVTANELQESLQLVHLKGAALHLDGPAAPAPLEDAVDFERLLAPVGDLLPRVPGVSQTGVLAPGAEALRVRASVGDPLRVHHRDERVVEGHELGRRRATSRGARRELRKRRHEEGLLKKRE